MWRSINSQLRPFMPAIVILAFILISPFIVLSQVQSPVRNSSAELGRRIYREGILPSGKPMRAVVNPGVFPRLSLGPGQRFASKGSYIVKVSARGIEAASEWIIP